MAIVFQRVASAVGQSVTIDIGAAGNNRLLIVQYGDESQNTDDTAMGGTPSVDGKNFTLRISKNNPDGIGNSQEMWTHDEASLGSSNGSLSVSGGGIDGGSAIRVSLWYGVDDGLPTDTGFDDTTIGPTDSAINMDVPANGLVVLGYGNGNSFNSSGWTSPLTERVDAATNPPSSAGLGFASGIESSAQTNKQYTATGTASLRSTMLGMAFAEASTGENANGDGPVPAVTASGTAEITRNANGSPSLTPVTAAGTAIIRKTASGTAIITAIIAAGTALRIISAADGPGGSGPHMAPIEAAGNAVTGGTRSANGNPSLTEIAAAGSASIQRNANGAAIITPIEAAGIALILNTASGAAAITALDASGTVDLIRNANGSPAMPAVEATGLASTGALKVASGNPSITEISAAGAATIIRNASGAAQAAAITAAGTATIRNVANGAPVIPSSAAAGTALIIKSVSGAVSMTAVIASGIAIVGGVPVFQSTRLIGYVIDDVFVGYHLTELNFTGETK